MPNTSLNETVTENGMLQSDQVATIADPAGGATVDAEARAAIALIIDALEAHNLVSDS